MATDNIKVNIKYGTRAKMVGEGTEPSIANGTLYVATKDNSRAELYVDLNNNRYIISDAIPVDNVLNTTSSNAIQNAVVSTELASLEDLIGEAEEEIGKVKESLDEYLLKEGGTITGNLQVGGALSVTGQITAPGGIAGHASSAETAKTLTTTLPIDKGGTGQTTLEGVQNALGITSLSEDVVENTN